MTYFINKIAACLIATIAVLALRSDVAGLIGAETPYGRELSIVVFGVAFMAAMAGIPLMQGRASSPTPQPRD